MRLVIFAAVAAIGITACDRTDRITTPSNGTTVREVPADPCAKPDTLNGKPLHDREPCP